MFVVCAGVLDTFLGLYQLVRYCGCLLILLGVFFKRKCIFFNNFSRKVRFANRLIIFA